MAGDRIAEALARIDAAASRIEAAARRPAPSAKGDPELERKYQDLRREAGAALAELDQIIRTIEP